jgi:hypothetical protein
MTCLVSASTAIGLAVGVGAPAQAATADPPLHGYAIHVDDRAGGHWLGSRRFNGVTVYRVDPGARLTSTPGFLGVRSVVQLPGSGAREVSRRDTSRAAYILSTYGVLNTEGAATQAAAVDVALSALLTGGAYSFYGPKTVARLKQSGNGTQIRSWAQTMLTDSKQMAGPYTPAGLGHRHHHRRRGDGDRAAARRPRPQPADQPDHRHPVRLAQGRPVPHRRSRLRARDVRRQPGR